MKNHFNHNNFLKKKICGGVIVTAAIWLLLVLGGVTVFADEEDGIDLQEPIVIEQVCDVALPEIPEKAMEIDDVDTTKEETDEAEEDTLKEVSDEISEDVLKELSQDTDTETPASIEETEALVADPLETSSLVLEDASSDAVNHLDSVTIEINADDETITLDIEQEDNVNKLSVTRTKDDKSEKTIYNNTSDITDINIIADSILLGMNAKTAAYGVDRNYLTMTLANILLQAKTIELVTDEGQTFTWNVNSMALQAIPSAIYTGSVIVFDDYTITVDNQEIYAASGVSIIACNKNNYEAETDSIEELVVDPENEGEDYAVIKALVQDPSKIQDILGSEANDVSLYVVIKDENAYINISNSKIEASDIRVNAHTRIESKMEAILVGVSATAIYSDAKVNITNSELKTSKKAEGSTGDVNIKANTRIVSEAGMSSNSTPFAIALNVILGDTSVDLTGCVIDAAGDANIIADRHVEASAVASGKQNNFAQTGVYIGASFIMGDAAVTTSDIKETAKKTDLRAVGNVNISAKNYGKGNINAVAQETHFDELSSTYYPSDYDVTLSKIEQILNDVIQENITRRIYDLMDVPLNYLTGKLLDPVMTALSDSFKTYSDPNKNIFVTDRFETVAADKTGVKAVIKADANCAALPKGLEMVFTRSEGSTDYVYTCSALSENSLEYSIATDELPEGTYSLKFNVPDGYQTIVSKKIQLTKGRQLVVEIAPIQTNYSKTQFAASTTAGVLLQNTKVDLQSKGDIAAGKDVNITANGDAVNESVADASSIDTVFQKVPEDNFIYLSMTTPNQEKTIATTFYISDTEGRAYNRGTVNTEGKDNSQNHKVVSFSVLYATAPIVENWTLKEGTYYYYFYLPEGKVLTSEEGYEKVNSMPWFFRESDWGNGKNWYKGEITLKTCTRQSVGVDGEKLYTVMGKPIMETYVEGVMEIVTVKTEGTTEGEIPSGRKSIGVGVDVNYVYNNTLAKVQNASISAENMNLSASSNGKSTSEAIAGFSSGDFGLAGSIAVNVVTNWVTAETQNCKICLTNGNLSVTAANDYDISNYAKGSGRKIDASGTGVGSGIAVTTDIQDTKACISQDTVITGLKDLTISAVTNGSDETVANAGAKGGVAVSPALAVSVIVADTEARFNTADGLEAQKMTGDLIIYASSAKSSSAESDASALGHKGAGGGCITTNVMVESQKAVLDRSIDGANNVTVSAKSAGSIAADSNASAVGAAPEVSTNTTTTGTGTAPATTAAPTADDSMNSALTSAKSTVQTVAPEKADAVPEETPANAETAEGSVDVAGSVSLTVWINDVFARINGTINCKNNVSAIAENTSDTSVIADSTAVDSKDGVGVAVAINYSDFDNIAEINGDVTAGTITVKAVNPESEDPDEDNANTMYMQSMSGVGASDVGVAGTVTINVYNETYRATVHNMKLTDANGSSLIYANAEHDFDLFSGASDDEQQGAGGTETSKSVGIGAAFCATFGFIDSTAEIASGSNVLSDGAITIQAVTYNSLDAHAYAGADAYLEPAEPGEIIFIFKDTDGNWIEGVEVEEGFLSSVKSNTQGEVSFDFKEGKTYNVRIVSVPTGFKLPSTTSFTYTAEPGTGYAKTVYLLKNNQIEKNQYASIDAAVAMNLLQSEVRAEICEGAEVDVKGALTVSSEANTDSWAYVRGAANAEGVAVGAAVTLNIAIEEVEAFVNGDVTCGNDLTVKAVTNTSDQSTAFATASGLQTDRLKEQFGVGIEKLMDDRFITQYVTQPVATYSPTTKITKFVDFFLSLLLDKTDIISDQNRSIMATLLGYFHTSVSQIKAIYNTVKTDGASALVAKREATATEDATGTVTSSDSVNVSFAAALGANASIHNAIARINGQVTMSGNGTVTVDAQGNNNYKAMATGEAVASETAIAAAVAFCINENEVSACLGNKVTANDNANANIVIHAAALQNLSDGYNDDVTVQAIAGAGKGSESGGAGVAGALSIFVNQQKVIAEIADDLVIDVNAGDVSVEAVEKSKISARAWGATLTNSHFNNSITKMDLYGGGTVVEVPSGSGAGVGAAFAIIYANNETRALVGDRVKITANSLKVNAEKQKVSDDDYHYGGLDLNGQIVVPITPAYTIQLNTTGWFGRERQPDSLYEITFQELLQAGIDFWNVFATSNYYLEAAGGSVASNSKFSGAGSFSFLYMNDQLEAALGKEVTLTLAKDAAITAKSEENVTVICGSLAYGTKVSAGMAAAAVINDEDITAAIGNGLLYSGEKLLVSADAETSVFSMLVAASISGKSDQLSEEEIAAFGKEVNTATSVDGVLNVYVGDTDVIASIGKNSTILKAADISVTASNEVNEIGLVGGAALGNGKGAGASFNIITLPERTIAYIGQGADIVNSGDLTIDARQNVTVVNITVNGGAAFGSESGTTLTASPTVMVIDSTTGAYLGTNGSDPDEKITMGTNVSSGGKITIHAEDVTTAADLAGNVAISTSKSGIGGSVAVNVLIKDVKALIADGDETYFVSINSCKGLEVNADAKETLVSVVIGLSGASKASAEGSVAVLVVSDDVLASIGERAYVDAGAYNILITASDDIIAIDLAGAVEVSVGSEKSVSAGFANVDMIFDGDIIAKIASNSRVKGNNITVSADAESKIASISAAGGLSMSGASLQGSMIVTVFEETVEALVETGANLTAAGDVSVSADAEYKVIDAAGSIGGSGGGSVFGASVDTIVLNGKTFAIVEKGCKVTSGGNVVVSANTDDNVYSVVAGVAVSIGGSAADGSVSTIVKNQKTMALLGTLDSDTDVLDGSGLVVSSGGHTVLFANDDADLVSIAGSLTVGTGTAAFGAGIITVTDFNTTRAEIGGKAIVDADAAADPYDLPIGDVSVVEVVPENGPSVELKKSKRALKQMKGIIVGAFNNNAVNLVAASGSGSAGSAGVSGAVVTLVQGNNSIARVGSSAALNSNNRDRRSSSSVTVAASSDTEESATSGSAGVSGTAGIAAAVVTYVGQKTVKAEILSASSVFAGKDLGVYALHNTDLYVNGVGAAIGGSASVGGSSSVIVAEDTVEAFVDADLTTDSGAISIIANSNVFIEASSTTVSASGSAGNGASIGVITFSGTTTAILEGGHSISCAGNMTISAASKEMAVLVVLGAAGSGAESLTGQAAAVAMGVTTQAIIKDNKNTNTKILVGGTLTVSAFDDTNITLAAGGLSATGEAALGLALEVTVYRSTITAMIGNNNIISAGAVDLSAKAERTVNSHAAMLAGSGAVNIEGSVVVLTVGAYTSNEHADDIDGNEALSTNTTKELSSRSDAAVKQSLGFKVQAESNNDYLDETNKKLNEISNAHADMVSGIFTDSIAVEDKTGAYIGDGGSTESVKGDISVIASDKLTLNATAGAVGGSQYASFGVSGAVAVLAGVAEAQIGGNITSAGNVIVKAYDNVNEQEFTAVGGGGALGAAVNGTVTVTVVESAARATINKDAVVYADKNVLVYADAKTTARAINGNVGGAGIAAIGAAINVIYDGGDTTAVILAKQVVAKGNGSGLDFIDGDVADQMDADAFKTALGQNGGEAVSGDEQQNIKNVSTEAVETKAQGILVGAHSENNLYNYIASAGGAGAAAVMGSINVVTFIRNTYAGIVNTKAETLSDYNTDVIVIALDNTAMQDIVGAFAPIGAVAAGVANDTLYYDNTVTAEIKYAEISSSRNIIVDANSKTDLLNIAAGGAGGVVTVNDSNVVVVLEKDTKSLVSGSKLDSYGSIRISSEDDHNDVMLAGCVAVSEAAAGAGVIVVVNSSTTMAEVSDASILNAAGNYSLLAYDGTFTGEGKDRTPNKAEQFGIFVQAHAMETPDYVAFSAIGSGFAVVASTITIVNNNTVSAVTKADSKINQSYADDPLSMYTEANVVVAAYDFNKASLGSGVATTGGASISAGVLVLDQDTKVTAEAGGDIYVANTLGVYADQQSDLILVNTGADLSLIGTTSTVTTLNFDTTVQAFTTGNLDVTNLDVFANTANKINLDTVIAIVDGVSASNAVDVIVFDGITEAVVNSPKVDFYKNASIKATSSEDVYVLATTNAFAGGAELASVIVLDMSAKTKACTADGTEMNGNGSGSLALTAIDTTKHELYCTTANVSVSAGANAAVVVDTFNNEASAAIGENNTITVSDLNMTAQADRKISGYAVSGTGSLLASLNGSVMVISIGDSMNDEEKNSVTGGLKEKTSEAVNQSLAAGQLQDGGQNGSDIRSSATNVLKESSVPTDAIFTDALLSETKTQIGSGTTVILTGDAAMTADDTTVLDVTCGSAAAAGLVGAGGSVLITDVDANVVSLMEGTIEKASSAGKNAGDVTITANQTVNTTNYTAFMGTGGYATSLGAGVAILDINAIVVSEVSETGKLVNLGNVTIKALQKADVKQQVVAASAGGISAAGVSIGRLTQNAFVKADLFAKEASVKSLTVYAISDIKEKIDVTAASGGITVSAAGVTSAVKDSASTIAAISGNVTAENDVTVIARNLITVDSTANGIDIASTATVGCTFTDIEIIPDVLAAINGNITAGGSVTVYALYNTSDDGQSKDSGVITVNASGVSAAIVASGIGIQTDIYHGISKDGVKKSTIKAEASGTVKAKNVDILSKDYVKIVEANGAFNADLGAAAGGVVVTINDTLNTAADVSADITASENITINSSHNSVVHSEINGLAAGLIVETECLKLTFTEKHDVLVNVSGNLSAGNDIVIAAKITDEPIDDVDTDGNTLSDIYGIIKGFNCSGALAIGDSRLTFDMDADILVVISENAALNAGGQISIEADNDQDINVNGYASSVAAISANANVIQHIDADFTTKVTADQAVIQAKKDIAIKANSNISMIGIASESVYAVGAAYGNADQQVTLNDTAEVSLKGAFVNTNNGSIAIEAVSDIQKGDYTMESGSGAIGEGVDDKNIVALTQKANVYLDEAAKITTSSDKDIVVKALVGMNINAVGSGDVDYSGVTNATVVDHISSLANAAVLLGGSALTTNGSVLIMADYSNIKYNAKTHVDAVSAISGTFSTDARVDASVNMTVGGDAKITAGKDLQIVAGHKPSDELSSQVDSYTGDKGLIGNMDTTANNDLAIEAHVHISDRLAAHTILLEAYAPADSEVTYTKKAESNKDFGWNDKSEETGSYSFLSCQELNADIYYGDSAPIVIAVNENGSILNSDVIYTIDENNKIVEIIQVKPQDMGGLTIRANAGEVSGKANVYFKEKADQLTIYNHSDYDLVFDEIDVDYLTEVPDSSKYYTLDAEDGTNLTVTNKMSENMKSATEIRIISEKGTDVTIGGQLLFPNGSLYVDFENEKGALFLGEKGEVIVNQILVNNACQVGRAEQPFEVFAVLYEGQDGVCSEPLLRFDVSDDFYAAISLVKYISAASEEEKNAAIQNNQTLTTKGSILEPVSVTGDLVVLLNPAYLMFEETASEELVPTVAELEILKLSKDAMTAEKTTKTYTFDSNSSTGNHKLSLEKTGSNYILAETVYQGALTDIESESIHPILRAGGNLLLAGSVRDGSLILGISSAEGDAAVSLVADADKEAELVIYDLTAGKKAFVTNENGSVEAALITAGSTIEITAAKNVENVRFKAPEILITAGNDVCNAEIAHAVEFSQFIADHITITAGGNVGTEEHCIESKSYTPGYKLEPVVQAGGTVVWHDGSENFSHVKIASKDRSIKLEILADGSRMIRSMKDKNPEPVPEDDEKDEPLETGSYSDQCNSPKTGDQTDAILWAMMLMVALAAACVIWKKRGLCA